MSILAHLDRPTSANRRASPRRRLQLQAEGSTEAAAGALVMIHDLSRTGMLIETSNGLSVGERLEVRLPEAGATEATIVWHSGRFFGCKFEEPISAAAVSAALLRSDPTLPADEDSDFAAAALYELQSLTARVRRLTTQLDRVIEGLERPKRH